MLIRDSKEPLYPFLVEFDGKQFYVWHRSTTGAHNAAYDARKAKEPKNPAPGTTITVKPAEDFVGNVEFLEPFKLYPIYEFRDAQKNPPPIQDFKDNIRRIPEIQERIQETYAALTKVRGELNEATKHIAQAYLDFLSDSYTGPALPDRVTHQGWIIDIDADMLVELPENDIGQAVAFHRDASKTLSEF